jgi:hypothetical protein
VAALFKGDPIQVAVLYTLCNLIRVNGYYTPLAIKRVATVLRFGIQIASFLSSVKVYGNMGLTSPFSTKFIKPIPILPPFKSRIDGNTLTKLKSGTM